MIVFKGELSDKNKKILRKGMTKIQLIAMSIVSLLLCIPITYLTINYDTIFAIAYLAPVICVCLSVIPNPISIKNKQLPYCPNSITIDDGFVTVKGDSFCQTRPLEKVKCVYDNGDHYRIIFFFPHKSFHCLCQKDLITEGTIEEFVQLFPDKIVKGKQSANKS